MASTFASGFGSQYSAGLSNSASTDILRNRAFANHTTVTSVTKKRPKPLYFFNSSNGLRACDPNTLRDMGATRNAEYHINDQMDGIKNVTWRDLMQGDEELDKMARSSCDNWRSASTGFISKTAQTSPYSKTRNLLSKDELLKKSTD